MTNNMLTLVIYLRFNFDFRKEGSHCCITTNQTKGG